MRVSTVLALLLLSFCAFLAHSDDGAVTAAAAEDASSATDDIASSDAAEAAAAPASTDDVAAAAAAEEPVADDVNEETEPVAEGAVSDSESTAAIDATKPVQRGPFIDLIGETLLSLQMIDEQRAQLITQYTNEALSGKKVVGLYFSADWCGPCRQFTPELVNFYNKMNSRRGKENQFEIVWISRCRDFESFGQYFTHMNWLAMQPELAMGDHGTALSNKYKVKGIPTLVLLDEVGNVITTDARNKIPADKAGIGFPWRNPLATLYMNLVPKSLRLLLKSHIAEVKGKVQQTLKNALNGGKQAKTA